MYSQELADAEKRIAALEAENARLTEELKRREWRPIESAPKDATWIEVARIERAHYASGDGDGLMPAYDGWFMQRGDQSYYTALSFQPTHFRLLPEPPKEAANG